MVGEVSEQPAADRPHHEADSKQDRGVQLLQNRVIAGEERIGEIERKCGVRIEIVPLDQISDRSDEYRLQPAADVVQPERIGSNCDLTHGVHHTKVRRQTALKLLSERVLVR